MKKFTVRFGEMSCIETVIAPNETEAEMQIEAFMHTNHIWGDIIATDFECKINDVKMETLYDRYKECAYAETFIKYMERNGYNAETL